jgi:hypothetical protein
MRLKSADYIYLLLSCIAGVWQAWSFNYGKDSVLLVMTMSLPFALASYAHASLLDMTTIVGERPHWKRALLLWVGMPLSLVVGSLTILAETGSMYAIGLGWNDLPFYTLRLLIGEAAACLVWAKCLQVWLHQPTLHPSRIRYFFLVAALYAGVLLANTFSALIHETSDFFVVSVVGTMTSAMIVIFMRNKRQLAHANIRQVNPAQLM